jgi:hypothetical protein
MFHGAKVGTVTAGSKYKIRRPSSCARFSSGGKDALAPEIVSGTVAGQRMNAPSPFWQLLFAPEISPHPPTAVAMKLLQKHGKPLLLLPCPPHLAACGLELYPAQTLRSRVARSLAGWVLQARLPFGVKSVRVNLSLDDPFVRWLASLAQADPGVIPQFAVLAGNPNSPGQRLILLLFHPAGRPAGIVKAGVTEAARKLIEQEQQFLARVPNGVTGVPPLRGTFDNKKVRAIALDFLPGRPPRDSDEPALPNFLGNWLRPQHPVVFADTRIWRELSASSVQHPIFKLLAVSLRNQSCASALCHGDFAPWNVRVSPSGVWMALDWERGDLNGLPAWDWFHYVIQKCILVEHQTAESLADLVEALLVRDEFKTYAQAGGVTGYERALLQLYLLHHAEVVRPSEGLKVTHDLIQLLAARWR